MVLIQYVHGLRFPQVARSHDGDVPARLHLFARLFDHGDSVAHVASQRDKHTMRLQMWVLLKGLQRRLKSTLGA
jgi:hypothetical protein